ncbi:hypothetical protein GCM10010992_03040 [Cloacibacterium rupense]|uniref:F0F1-ATPase subunit Ca2+/Mg2+ transporter n=1 Tax=Cloacibacterium rupense TaxID=517423 RepID=A0ABQ2NKR4_9FLAO|nr:hypothetical protein [Cloacibacterium rupense]GGP01682.1 hypothetical protein GCM10010992_03040 [Cloacibacterium rupense]
MENKKTIFEKLIDAIYWIEIVASPTIIGLAIGYACKYYLESSFLFGFFTISGIILGIKFANKIAKTKGTTEFISRISASPDIDDAMKDKK